MKNKKFGALSILTVLSACLTSCGNASCQANIITTKSDTANCVVCDVVMKQDGVTLDTEDKIKNAGQWLPTNIVLTSTPKSEDGTSVSTDKHTVYLQLNADKTGFATANEYGVSVATDVKSYACLEKYYPYEFTIDCTDHLDDDSYTVQFGAFNIAGFNVTTTTPTELLTVLA